MKKPFLSVIVPVYNEEGNLKSLYYEIKGIATFLMKKERISNFEIIYINDGSRDRTQDVLEFIKKKEPKLKIIQFRRNFGETAGLKGGFDHAKGDLIVMIDGDGQDDPANIPRLMDKLEEGYDVVSGWRYNRRDSLLKKIVSRTINNLRQKMIGDYLHDYGCGLKIFKKECLEDLELFGELHRYITAYLFIKGYKVGELKVNHRARTRGRSKYGNFNRGINGLLDLFYLKFWANYSSKQLHFFGKLGAYQWLIAILIGFEQIIIEPLMGRDFNFGPLLALASTLMITGLLFIMLGFLSEISSRNYFISSNKKIYTIKKKIL